MGNCRAVSLATFLGEKVFVKQVFIEVFSKNMKDKKEKGWENPTQTYQGKLCFTNMMFSVMKPLTRWMKEELQMLLI